MSRQHYQTLFAYSGFTAEKLLDKAALLEEADLYAHPGYGHGSIYDIFFHVLSVSRGWRVAFETGTEPPRLQPAGFEHLPAVRNALAAEYTGWHAVLAQLSDPQIDGPVTLTRVNGEKAELVYWRVFEHLTLHAMQHHTEIAQLLSLKGQSPGNIDFLFYPG